MPLYDDLPRELQVLIDTPAKLNLLRKLGFENRSSIAENFPDEFTIVQSSSMQFLCIKYHGMGHSQIVTVDPTRSERPFYLLVVGGSDDWQRRENDGKLAQLNEDNYCNLTELLLYAYGTDEAPIYVDLKDLKHRVDIISFADFIATE